MKYYIFIIWKWEDLQTKGNIKKALINEVTSNKNIIRIHQNTLKDEKNNINIELFYKIFREYAKNEDKSLIMLHKSFGFNDNHIKKISKELHPANMKVYLFSGWEENTFIYYNSDTKTGLLDGRGAYDKNILLKNKIKENSFDIVWNYFWMYAKRKLYEFKEDLLIQLYPIVLETKRELNKDSKEKITIKSDWESSNLLSNMKSFINIENYSFFSNCINLYQEPEGGTIYEKLKSSIRKIVDQIDNIEKKKKDDKKILISISDIEILRKNFNKLLNKLQGNIY